MVERFVMRSLLLLVLTVSVFGSHFRGGVIMVRPVTGGEPNEVGIVANMYISLHHVLLGLVQAHTPSWRITPQHRHVAI